MLHLHEFQQQRQQKERPYPNNRIPSYMLPHLASLPSGIEQRYKEHYNNMTPTSPYQQFHLNPYNPSELAHVTPVWSGSNATSSNPTYHIPSAFSSTYDNRADQTSSQLFPCPHCNTHRPHFRLPNDRTNSVYCSNCKQPYFICPVHHKIWQGLGPHKEDRSPHVCQCNTAQSFLQQTQWNSCFK